MKKHILLAVATAALGITAAAALATGGSGILEATVQARGTLDEGKPGHHVMIKLKETSDVVVQKIRIGPGGHTGWHTHPGAVVVIVKAGALTTYDGDDPTCTGRVYDTNAVFVDHGHGHVHIARNEGTTEVELWVTYLEVGVGGPFRIDALAPGNCPF